MENDFLTKYFPNILEVDCGDIALRCSTILCQVLTLIFLSIVDIVPVMVYYYAAKLIWAMEFEIKALFGPSVIQSEIVHRVWFKFERLRVLITRADGRFGPIMIVSHGCGFFIFCSTVFSLLNMIRKPEEEEFLPVFVTCLLLVPPRLFFSFGMIVKVHTAAGALLTTVVRLSARNARSDGSQRILTSIHHQSRLMVSFDLSTNKYFY